MKYSVVIKPRAEKELFRLTGKDFERVRQKIGELADNPRPFGICQLKTRESYRIRVGSFRVIYSINDERKIVEILDVLRRNEQTYKGL